MTAPRLPPAKTTAERARQIAGALIGFLSVEVSPEDRQELAALVEDALCREAGRAYQRLVGQMERGGWVRKVRTKMAARGRRRGVRR